jgi:drug/metabolite transporter (DMT)-like permease
VGKNSYLLLGLLGLIWGSSFLFIKLGVDEMPPAFVAGGRLACGLVLLLIAMRVQHLQMPPQKLWGPLLVVAFLNNVVPWILIPWGEQRISSSLASILNATMPLFTVMIAHFATQDDRLNGTKVGGILLGFVGVAVLIGTDLRDLTGASALGDLAVLVSCVAYGAAAVYARQNLRGQDHTVLATGQLGFGLLITTPLMLLSIGGLHAVPSMKALLAVGALGVLGSGVAYLIYYWLIERASASQVSLVTYLLPVTAVLWGAAILNETIGLNAIAGLILICGGIFLVNRSSAPAPAPAATGRPALVD